MTATATPRTTTHIPIAASLMALGAGVVWSFGAVTARMAKHADPFQYLIWRSVGVLVVMELVAAFRRRPMLLPKAYTSGKWMLWADFGLLLASFMFVYAVKTTTAANASFLGSVTPLAAVVMARLVLGERLSRVTLAAIFVASFGLVVTVFGDLHAGNMGTVSLDAPVDRNEEITKSSIEPANTTIRLAKIAGPNNGSNTRRIACIRFAPRSRAASSYCGPIAASRPRTITTTYEMLNVMCPSNWVVKPRGTLV